jgi:hypothetical protein
MSDVHLRILRAAARTRARQLAAHHSEPGESAASAHARGVSLEQLATRARRQLSGARARRSGAATSE